MTMTTTMILLISPPILPHNWMYLHLVWQKLFHYTIIMFCHVMIPFHHIMSSYCHVMSSPWCFLTQPQKVTTSRLRMNYWNHSLFWLPLLLSSSFLIIIIIIIIVSTLLCYISWSSGYWNIDDRHRHPNINIREIIWLGNQLHHCHHCLDQHHHRHLPHPHHHPFHRHHHDGKEQSRRVGGDISCNSSYPSYGPSTISFSCHQHPHQHHHHCHVMDIVHHSGHHMNHQCNAAMIAPQSTKVVFCPNTESCWKQTCAHFKASVIQVSIWFSWSSIILSEA